MEGEYYTTECLIATPEVPNNNDIKCSLFIAHTVPTFNSCTKCVVSSGIIHDCMPYCHPEHGSMHDLTAESSFDSQSYLGNCFAWFIFYVTYRCLYNQALADVRSTGAGIKCLHCM